MLQSVMPSEAVFYAFLLQECSEFVASVLTAMV